MDRRKGILITLRVATVIALVLATVAAAWPSEPERRALRAVERVRIVDDAFQPRSITVPRGTRVRWTNTGDRVHTTTSARGLWDSGLLDPGEAFSRVFRRAGTFRYTCTVHPTMRARVVVT